MKTTLRKNIALLIIFSAVPADSYAHGGGLDAMGCHHDRKNGGYHCHGKPTRNTQSNATNPSASVQDSIDGIGGVAENNSEKIKIIQERLTQLGYDVGAVDGVISLKTNLAILKFKKDRKLKFDAYDYDAVISALSKAVNR
jgi:hypothetical protein